MNEMWDNPLIPLDERFEILKGALEFRLKVKDTKIANVEAQLAGAVAACKMKDEQLEAAHNGLRWWMDAFPEHVSEADHEEMAKMDNALNIQPDDTALKQWMGEPIDAIRLDDCVDGAHPAYGSGWFATDNCVVQLYELKD
jgi:hypothetical protein